MSMSPKTKVRASQEQFPGGDDTLAEEVLQSAMNDVSEEEADEELAQLDLQAHRQARRRKVRKDGRVGENERR